MRLKINLATRTYLNARVITVSTVMLVGVLLLTVLLLVKSIAGNAGEIELLDRDIAGLQGRTKGDVSEKDYQSVMGHVAFANGIIAKKTYNWLLLLDSLERVVPDGIAITSISPDPKSSSLKLTGVAKTFYNVRQFVERLEDDKTFFSDVYLLGQNDTKVGTSQTGTTFSISCKVTLK